MSIDDRIILIVGLTVIVIVAVIAVRVLTGRGWSNLSKKAGGNPKAGSTTKDSSF